MENATNLTFGEGSEVPASSQPQELREVLLALKRKIIELEKELDHVKGQAAKPEQKAEEMVGSKYQIYFQKPKAPN